MTRKVDGKLDSHIFITKLHFNYEMKHHYKIGATAKAETTHTKSVERTSGKKAPPNAGAYK